MNALARMFRNSFSKFFIFFAFGRTAVNISNLNNNKTYRRGAFWNWNSFSASFSTCSCFTGIWNTLRYRERLFTPLFPFVHVWLLWIFWQQASKYLFMMCNTIAPPTTTTTHLSNSDVYRSLERLALCAPALKVLSLVPEILSSKRFIHNREMFENKLEQKSTWIFIHLWKSYYLKHRLFKYVA